MFRTWQSSAVYRDRENEQKLQGNWDKPNAGAVLILALYRGTVHRALAVIFMYQLE